MTQRSKAETLALSVDEYSAARATLLADAEALRKGQKAPQTTNDAPQASTTPSDAPVDGPISTSSTNRAPSPHAGRPRTVIGMTREEYDAERKAYLARFRK
jgi:hypothetical protein